MWLFVFIVATFFYLYITIGFRLLDTSKACGEQRGCSPFDGKIRVQNEVFAGAYGGKYHFVSGDFSAKRQKNSPAPHVSESEQATLPEMIVSHNLELSLRDGENE